MRRLAVVLEKGAKKYTARNWEKGIPMSRCLDSALRHLHQWQSGKRDEDHLAQAVFNVMALIHFEELDQFYSPETLDIEFSPTPEYYMAEMYEVDQTEEDVPDQQYFPFMDRLKEISDPDYDPLKEKECGCPKEEAPRSADCQPDEGAANTGGDSSPPPDSSLPTEEHLRITIARWEAAGKPLPWSDT